MKELGKSRFLRTSACLLLAASLVPAGTAIAEKRRPSRAVDDLRLLDRIPRVELRPGAPHDASTSRATEAVAGTAIPDAMDWLETSQNLSGSWGSAFEFTDTATVVESLGRAQPAGQPFSQGVGWLTGHLAADNDERARQILALDQAAGLDIEDLVDELLSSRNPAETDVSAPNFPEGGWGLQPGFETDSLTTSLALLALEAADRKAGIGRVDEALAASTTNVHPWEVASDATQVRIRITVAGSAVHLRMTQGAPPTGAEPFFNLPAGGTFELLFPDSLPFTPGTNFIGIESTGAAATYSFTASYQTPTFDTRAFAQALDYLRRSQNVDGGWGLQIGDPTSFFTTLHVLLALLQWGDYDFDAELASGVAYLGAQQLVDGSFGVGGTGIPYQTALAASVLIRDEVCPFGAATEDTITALLAQQDVDGSWVQEPYDTGLALQALSEYDNDGDGVFQDGDCSGSVGDNLCTMGMTTGCDDNCVDFFNLTQGSVTFDQTILAPNETSFIWSNPVDIAFVKGDLSTVSSYGVIEGGAASFATALSTFGDNPAPGAALYYLVRRAGDCMGLSWQSSLGAEPGRDAASLGQVDLQITDPADGAVLTGSPTTVSGTVNGADPITVTVNGIPATVTAGTFSASVPLVRGANTITAMATDAASFMGTSQVSVTKVDYSIGIGGMAAGSRIFTAASATLDQIAFFTENQIGVPTGVVYGTTLVQRISATEMQISFEIDVNGAATPGIYFFQVEYGLLDAAMMPLGPLTGNTFDFQIEIP